MSSEPVEFASVERRKLFPLDRGSRRESTANNSKPRSFFPFLSESINRNEINREKLRLPRLRGARTVRASPSRSSPRLSVRKNFRSRVVSCAPGTASFESNFDTRDAISTQRVCKFSRSVDVVEVKERRRAAVWPYFPFFPGFSRAKEIIPCYAPSHSLLPSFRRPRYIFERYFTC